MSRASRSKSFVSLVLALAMLAVVLAAGLLPNTGGTVAQPSSTYVSSSSSVSPWAYIGAAVVAIAAALLLALFLLRRRRPPPAVTAPPVQAWQGGPGAGTPPTAPPPPPPPPAVAPAYLEIPADVGRAPPPFLPTAGTAAGTGLAAGAVSGGTEPDIDSLMAELDKISGEILKRGAKNSAKGKGTGTDAEPGAND
jgi:MYXO-CTERM domain-containing protein